MTADPPHDQRVIVRRHFLIVVLFAATLWRLHSAPVLANVTPDSETVVPEDDPEEGDGVALTPVAGPLEHPWSIAFLGDRTILVTERPGRLRIIDHDGLRPEEIKGVPEVLTGGHAGLFDIALDPNFVHNRHLYISYVHGTVEAATVRVMRARFTGTSLVDRWVIYETPRSAAGLEQFGGRLAFGGDGMLYLTLGDRIQMERAQDLGDPWGKILRLYSDGRAPADNPFVGTPGALPEIWTYGHRNPQGLAFDPQTGRLWAHEHAPQGGDELNLVLRAGNYGWPRVTHGRGYDHQPIGMGTTLPGMEPPIHHWVPSIAPSGLAIYRGEVFPRWTGDLILGSLLKQMVIRLRLSDTTVVSEENLVRGAVGRIRDVRVSPTGEIYLATDEHAGGLYRLEPLAVSVRRSEQPTPGSR
jgi:glucose/arabinose dehydrogenase